MYTVAHVIPCRKTPYDKETFSYLVPPELTIKRGDLIKIPFQTGYMLGVVDQLITTRVLPTTFSLKTIAGHFHGLSLPPAMMAMLQALSQHVFYPKSGILKTWFRTIPKRIWSKEQEKPQPNHSTSKGTIETYWDEKPFQRLKQTVQTAIDGGKRTIIIMPWKHQLTKIQAEFPDITILDSDTNDTLYTQTWMDWLQGKKKIIATTRIGAWLMGAAELCILFEPENEDHKQDEQQPRFDTRWMAKWCTSEKYLDIISIGVTPPLHNQHQSAPTISVQSHLIEIVPQAHSNVPCLQPSTIHFIEDCETSVTIIHPVKGKQGSIGCWDCGWKMTCSTCHGRMRLVETSAICAYCHQKSEPPLTCPQCQGLKLNKGIPGIDQLKQQWKKHQTKAVEWRTTDNESLSRPFAKQSFVIVTLPELLSGHGEDMRAHERFVNRLRRLAAAVLEAEGTLALQQKIESDTSFFSLLSTDGYEKWRNQELKDRQVFNYPPYSKIIKILLDLAPEDVNTLMNEWKKKLPPIWKVKGPYELEMPSKSRRKRLVFQLICPKETPEKQLIQALDILKRYGIIDLDPIAFFR